MTGSDDRRNGSGNGQGATPAGWQSDAAAFATEAHGHEAPMFQGLQGGRPVAERAGHQERRRRRRGEPTVVPEVEFRSYYGRPVLKPPVWKHEIPAYLFTGGLAAGTAVVGAGADLTGRPALRRASWLGSFGALLASAFLLVIDLGRPERFHHMLRVIKPTSPMSVGTWIISAFGPGCGAAALNELVPLLPRGWRRSWPVRLLGRLARPLGLSAAAVAPALGSYTAVLLSHTAVPGWNEVRDELPFVFAGSAAASGGGFGMLAAPVAENGPARVFAAVGAAQELVAGRVMDQKMGLVKEAYEDHHVARFGHGAEWLTIVGLAGTVLLAGRSRVGAAASGLALLAGSACQRFRVFEAGVVSTKDPKYVVVPQRERLQAR